MLIQYSVKNYKSIKDEVIINFSANNKNISPKLLINEGKVPLYKTIGLVGPNASGKSNILDSFLFSLRFINSTIRRKESSKTGVEPFKLCDEAENESSDFEFIFFENDVKYVYGFSIDSEKVIEEYLLAYYSKKATTIFERVFGREKEYDFRGNDTRIQKDISTKTNANRLYMPVAAEWGYDKVKVVYKWFEKMYRRYMNMDTRKAIEQVVSDENTKERLVDFLKKSDFNISDVSVKKKKMEKKYKDIIENFLSQLLGDEDIPFEKLPDESPIIIITHEGKSGKSVSIELENDSSGTQEIINTLAELFFINNEGGIIINDELGSSFHTKLFEHYINLFNDDKYNNGKVQMIFSTHETKVFNLLNPEQIYLVDKDEDGGTYVKLLDDYIIREKDNIELGYLKGRYGAIPNIEV